MVVLKKIKAATLMETMVATVLIVVVFMISSMLLNSIFLSTINGNKQPIQEHLNELEYAYKSGSIKVPYTEQWKEWNISSSLVSKGEGNYIRFDAVNQTTGKTVLSYVYENEN